MLEYNNLSPGHFKLAHNFKPVNIKKKLIARFKQILKPPPLHTQNTNKNNASGKCPRTTAVLIAIMETVMVLILNLSSAV